MSIYNTEDKKPSKSITIWVMSLSALIGIAQVLQGDLQSGVQLTIVGIAGIILRGITKSGIMLVDN